MNHIKRTICSTLALFAASFSVWSQPVEYNFDLKEALLFGLENSLSIRQAVLDQSQSEHVVGEVRATGLPQVTGEGQYQNFPNLPTQLLPGEIVGQPGTQIPVQFGTENTMSGTIKATQLIYNQQFFTGLRAAKSSRQLYELLKIKTEEDVIYEVSNAYYMVLELKAQRNVLDSNVAQLNKLEELMKLQYENDLVTQTDLGRIRVNRMNLQTQLQSVKIGLEQQKNYLKLLLGMDISNTLIIRAPEDIEDVSLQTLQYEKEQSIELEILDQQLTLNELNKKSIQAEYAPTLAVFGQQSWQAQRNEWNFFDSNQPWFQQTVVGVQLSVPIFDGLSKHHRIQQSEIDIQKVRLQQTNAQRSLDMQFQNAREQLTNSLASVEAQRDNKELAKDVYEQTQLLYKEQVVGLTDLLDAEQAYRQAETSFYNELLKFRRSELDLLKAQGQLKQIIQ
ncbi:TolC family protein [Phaeocystidibacter marisrubri]|uniref:TolC family protein n=1 Tax=Phaeocystidibacter marisrubri TaxID=1577780 RepID=A0A6L3ZF37_9FLAO|nr:TolC family protein [Phaeocystidibacter marisrubri]KAB2816451.1 TolC family protein [Phaeocystidibacter marisrubri]GGH69122.1 transporter [Phaeocystidibacter marisrubri]